MDPLKTDIGGIHSARLALAFDMVAGGANDNTLKTGAWIDRSHPGASGLPAFSPRTSGPYGSMTAWLVGQATLAAAATLTLVTGSLETAADTNGTGAVTAVTLTPSQLIATGPGGGGTVPFNLRLADKAFYLSTDGTTWRVKLTLDLSAGSVDVAIAAVVFVFGGSDLKPVV